MSYLAHRKEFGPYIDAAPAFDDADLIVAGNRRAFAFEREVLILRGGDAAIVDLFAVHINLDGVIEKTVDTLAFLWAKKNRLAGGLSLSNLSELNLRGTKGDLGQHVEDDHLEAALDRIGDAEHGIESGRPGLRHDSAVKGGWIAATKAPDLKKAAQHLSILLA